MKFGEIKTLEDVAELIYQSQSPFDLTNEQVLQCIKIIKSKKDIPKAEIDSWTWLAYCGIQGAMGICVMLKGLEQEANDIKPDAPNDDTDIPT